MNISSVPDACNINIYNPTYLIIYVTLVNYKIIITCKSRCNYTITEYKIISFCTANTLLKKVE